MANRLRWHRKAHARVGFAELLEQHFDDLGRYGLPPHRDRLVTEPDENAPIEKLRANPLDQRLQPVRATGGSGAFSAVNFVLILILAVGIGLNGWFLWMSFQKQQYQDTILVAMLNERIKNYNTAEDLLKQAQAQLPGEPLAYRFLAELYLEQNQFKLADIEGRKWQVADPGDKAVSEFRMRLKSAQESAGMQ